MIWVGVRSSKASVDDGICMNRFAINMEGRKGMPALGL